MSPSKLSRMAFSQHDRYSGSGTTVRCADPRTPTKRLLRSRMAVIRGFLAREWKEIRQLWRYFRLKREGERVMREYTRIAEAMGYALMSPPHSTQQQQRLARVHDIRAEMIAIRWNTRP